MKTLEILKQAVLSVNKILKEKVKTMKPMELLRNCHPIYREVYAMTLYKEGVISKDEESKFTRL